MTDCGLLGRSDPELAKSTPGSRRIGRKGAEMSAKKIHVKKLAGTATLAGALSLAALGFGAGTVQADPGPRIPGPPGPHFDGGGNWRPLPPGQIKKVCPWQSPPGHWIGGPHGVPCT
ncbi:hypothetical protein MB901379_02417 [Mycobacterium basiliense]|uniref:Uncharacterized protein n=2 Tax=Mycobacterium basiliense TaxID=2094119 RepID=A0A3S4CVW6_9MYCO|nr:hypothetical protein MB901379_02417 [Mycobacterium basiliense]